MRTYMSAATIKSNNNIPETSIFEYMNKYINEYIEGNMV